LVFDARRGCGAAEGRIMWHQTGAFLFGLVFASSGAFSGPALVGQQAPSPSASPVSASTPAGPLEFPVTLIENVVAGKTAVGTAVQAKLIVATLVNGVVVPKNAVFSGVIVESAEKSKADPSRLSIRMDSVQWKDGSIPIRVYLTPWYYPTAEQEGEDLQYGPTKSAKATWNGQGQYPDDRSKIYQPFPSGDSKKGETAPNTPSAVTSNHRVPMKNVMSSLDSEGAITIASKHSNLKLDKFTTYVLANGDLLPPAKDSHAAAR
jgi:hypothetical protein